MLLWRYRQVFATAWQRRDELAGPARLTDERAFLPAVLSLQETPVHPAPRRLIWLIMALFAAALAWSFLGKVDIVAVAPGRVVIADRSKTVQPLEPGTVRAIHVRDGDRVDAGQILIELDPTQAEADGQAVAEQSRTATAELQRVQALLASLQAGRLVAPLSLSSQQAALLAAEWAEIGGRSARIEAEIARRQSELVTVGETVAKLRAMLPLARQRETDYTTLGREGMVSSHAVQDRARERLEIERDLAAQLARIGEVEAALAESRQARVAEAAAVQRSLHERGTKARAELAQLAPQDAKTRQRQRLTLLTAPVSGTVQQLAVHTTGGVVTSAQPLMVIVPDGARVTAEVTVANQDIGFVREGQEAQVKLETFNFTRYGTVPATVRRVSADAVVDDKGGAFFTATLSFERDTLSVEGRTVRLAAGMNLVAEITTGRRRVIEYLTQPVRQALAESLRER
jgi:hemolysin D